MKQHHPPEFALRFFRWYCHPRIHNYIEGDLIEVYQRRRQSGKLKADLLFIIDVLLLCRPGIVGIKKNYELNNLAMVRTNFKIAFRSLWKNKPSTLINVFGLTTGITSCLLIALFVQYELSFDTFQPNGSRIARVIMEYRFDGSTESTKGNFTSSKVAPVLSRTFPEVEKGIRMTDADMIVQLNSEPVMERNFLFADSSFFDAFHYDVTEGNPAKALDGPNKLVLTESTARRYFQNERAVGKILLLGNKATPYEVTAVIKDYPQNSQFHFDFLASFSSLGANQEQTYYNANYTTYLLLKDDQSIASLQEKLHPFMEKEMKGTGSSIRFHLEQFSRVHLYSPYPAFVPNTDINHIYLLVGVALLIVAIVCATYINLSTARSLERAKEVGIRKVSGAARTQLFGQFIGEAFLTCSLSVIVSFALATLALPFFNLVIERSFQTTDMFSPSFLVVTVSVTLMVSFIAGGYPALMLSGLQPARILKGVFKNTNSARRLQNSLVVFQFAISVLLIISTIVIQNQLSFIQNKNLGYDRTHVLSLPIGWGTDQPQMLTLKKELKKHAQILEISRCARSPISIESGYNMRIGSMPKDEVIGVNANPVDENYIQTAGLQLIAGTDFTQQDMTDLSPEKWEDKKFHYILNETAVKKLGWTPEEAIGKEMQLNAPGIIRGVVKDFHFQSMHNTINPIVLFTADWGGQLLIKVSGNDIAGTISYIEQQWKRIVPQRPFSYDFLDNEYNRLYKAEIQLGQIMSFFSTIAIILASLGLFGLSSYMVQQRMKEIGIRKVLGASTLNLLRVLSGSFAFLIIIAITIGLPLSYWLIQDWLDGFAYRIDLPWWAFGFACAITLLIALTTVSLHVVRAARTNPVNTLRSE